VIKIFRRHINELVIGHRLAHVQGNQRKSRELFFIWLPVKTMSLAALRLSTLIMV